MTVATATRWQNNTILNDTILNDSTLITPLNSALSHTYVDSLTPGIDLDWIIACERMGMIGGSIPRYSTNTHHAMLIVHAYPELIFTLMKLTDGQFNATFYRDGEPPVWARSPSAALSICRAILYSDAGKRN